MGVQEQLEVQKQPNVASLTEVIYPSFVSNKGRCFFSVPSLLKPCVNWALDNLLECTKKQILSEECYWTENLGGKYVQTFSSTQLLVKCMSLSV